MFTCECRHKSCVEVLPPNVCSGHRPELYCWKSNHFQQNALPPTYVHEFFNFEKKIPLLGTPILCRIDCLQNKICTKPIRFFLEEEDAGSSPVWVEPSFMRTKGMETSVGENEWGEQGKDNWRRKRSWRVHAYYLCPCTSREQEVPNPSFNPPLCHALFSSQGVILWSLQCNMSEGCHWNSSLSLPSLLTVCFCPATFLLQALGRDHLFSKSAQRIDLAADESFFATLFTIFSHANLHMSWTKKPWNFTLCCTDIAIRVAFFCFFQ